MSWRWDEVIWAEGDFFWWAIQFTNGAGHNDPTLAFDEFREMGYAFEL